MHIAILRLLVPHPHLVLKRELGLDQVELSDQLDEVVAAEPLPTLLLQLVLVDLVDFDLVFAHFGASVLHEYVELHELQTVVGVLAREH